MKNAVNSAKGRFLAVCALVVLVMGVYSAAAQPPLPDDPNSAPIYGGLSLLLGAGAATAALKYRATSKSR